MEENFIIRHCNLVIQTKDEYEADKRKTAEDAFQAGRYSAFYECGDSFEKDETVYPNVRAYLTQLFK